MDYVQNPGLHGLYTLHVHVQLVLQIILHAVMQVMTMHTLNIAASCKDVQPGVLFITPVDQELQISSTVYG